MWNDKLLQKRDKGLLFVISAPAGTGKTTLAKRLTQTFPSLGMPPSITTRAPRAGETSGIDYIFVSESEFTARREQGEFLEEVFIHGSWYATSRALIDKFINSGRNVILVIDTKGALAVQKQRPCVLLFIKPPSMEALHDRLKLRATEPPEDQKNRLQIAERELLEECHFDFSITNDDLDRAFDVLASIIVSQTHKVQRETCLDQCDKMNS